MPRPPWPLVRALAQHAGLVGATDADLLARFAADRDPAAFELLVWRHGRMVLAVCRRVLRDPHRADDAFQATFLILARKAGAVRGSAVGYLHRVARRVAIRSAQRDARRRETSLTVDPFTRQDDGADPLLRAVLDEEIDRLPDRLRLPVVLCYLDGRSTEEAAALLGVPRGTVLSRLSAARAKLAARLTRRGVSAPAAGLTATLGASGPALSGATVTTVLSAVGRPPGAAGPAFLLAREVMRAALWQKLTAATMAAVLVGGTGVGIVRLSGGGIGGAVAQAAADPPAKPTEAKPAAPAAEQEAKRLAERVAKIDHEIAVRTEDLLRLAAVPDVSDQVLADAIVKIDRNLIEIEDGILNGKRDRERVVKDLAAASRPATPEQIERLVEASLPEVWSARQVLRQADEVLAEARGKYPADGPQVRAAEGRRAMAAKALEKAQADARPKVDEVYTTMVSGLQEQLNQLDVNKSFAEAQRAALTARRAELADRLATAKAYAERAKRIEHQLQVMREVRQQLYRRQLVADLGVGDLPAGPPPAAGADRLDQLARDVAELKASLRTRDGQDKLDALRQAVDGLANQVRGAQGGVGVPPPR
jgi:RNA polymerase sigma factor (sigma-70 family)